MSLSLEALTTFDDLELLTGEVPVCLRAVPWMHNLVVAC